MVAPGGLSFLLRIPRLVPVSRPITVTRLLNLSVTLVLLFGLTILGLSAPPAVFSGAEVAVLMGFLLL